MDEEEGKNQIVFNRVIEPEIPLQWGNRKRLRRMKIKYQNSIEKSEGCGITTNNNSSLGTQKSDGINDNQNYSAEKEDRYYTTRRSLLGFDDNMKIFMGTEGVEDRGFVWPKLFTCLSSKEKEEDFMAMKGCKLPQRPKKRAKFIQRSLLLVSPGGWLSDLCQERYEVTEKKTSKKRARGLKAMGGSIESDSE